MGAFKGAIDGIQRPKICRDISTSHLEATVDPQNRNEIVRFPPGVAQNTANMRILTYEDHGALRGCILLKSFYV